LPQDFQPFFERPIGGGISLPLALSPPLRAISGRYPYPFERLAVREEIDPARKINRHTAAG